METFKQISIGGLKKETLINKLIGQGIQFNEYAKVLFEHSSFLAGDKPEIANLVKVRMEDFQFSQPVYFAEIVKKATALGLKLCPLYLGAFLRLEYLDQTQGPYLTVASAKPENDENYPNGFYLRNFENSLWLRGYRASDDYEWPMDSEFIFLK